MARPSKYESHVQPKLTLVEAWARDGLTDDQIAHNLSIAVSTLYEYKDKHPEFSEALKRGKDDIDVIVENALLKRALGYSYEEITREPVQVKPYTDEHGNVREHKLEVTKVVVKEVQPDTTAQIFWLKNRRPQAWRDKQDIEHSGQMTNKIDLSGLSVEDLKAYAKTKPVTT
jgi:hypothetical protein